MGDVLSGMLIVQDREDYIYEQIAVVPDKQTDLLIRSITNRTLLEKNAGVAMFRILIDIGGY